MAVLQHPSFMNLRSAPALLALRISRVFAPALALVASTALAPLVFGDPPDAELRALRAENAALRQRVAELELLVAPKPPESPEMRAGEQKGADRNSLVLGARAGAA